MESAFKDDYASMGWAWSSCSGTFEMIKKVAAFVARAPHIACRIGDGHCGGALPSEDFFNTLLYFDCPSRTRSHAGRKGVKEKLRIGLLLDAWEADAWACAMVERINAGDYARVELAVLNGIPASEKKSVFARLRDNRRTLASDIAGKLLALIQDKLIDRVDCDPDAFAPRDLRPLLAGVPVLEATPVRKKFSDRFREEDVEKIRSHRIDVFIRLGFRILRGGILGSAKYGVWSFHHGDNAVNRGGPAGFWEAMQSWPETGSILQILTEDLDNGKVLYRSYSSTYDLSVAYNRNGYFWKTLGFIPRKLKELHDLGGEAFMARVAEENRHPVFYSRRLYARPSNAEYARLLLRKLWQKARNNVFFRFYFHQWFLLFDLGPHFSGSLWRFKKILPPKDRFWADPHVLHRDGNYFIFIEELLYGTGKGHVSVIVMDEKGNHAPPVRVLEKPYHLSYPFVFEWENETYMIPETSENRTVELYRCVRFPDQWEFRMHLMENVDAVDATLFRWEGKWWLFANMVEQKGASSWDELFLFHSESLLSRDWKPHPLNPVVSDMKSARPAGRIFLQNGGIYRPSQDCSGHYGRGFNLCEITALSETDYREKVVASVKPDWDKNIVSVHHFTREKNLTVIDAQIVRRK